MQGGSNSGGGAVKVRTFAYPRRAFVFFVVAVIASGADGAYDMRRSGDGAMIATGCGFALFFAALLIAFLGRTVRIEGLGISIRCLGLSYRGFGWDEITDIEIQWRSGKTRSRYVVLLLRDGVQFPLPLPSPTTRSSDQRFDEEAQALIAAWHAARNRFGISVDDCLEFQTEPGEQAGQVGRTWPGPAKSQVVIVVQFLATTTWWWLRRGALQAVVAIASLVAMVVSVHSLDRDHAAVVAFQAAKPCTAAQYGAMTDTTQWCVLQDMVVNETLTGSSQSDVLGVLVVPDTSNLPATIQGLEDIQALGYDIFVYLDPSSTLPSRLAPGVQVAVTASVQQFDGNSLQLAGSIQYQGVTTQTQNSPLVQQAADRDSTATFAAWALFFGLWTAKSMRRRRGPAWSGWQGAAFGLAVGLTSGTVLQQDRLSSVSSLPAFGIGALAAAGGCVVFAALAWVFRGYRWQRIGGSPFAYLTRR